MTFEFNEGAAIEVGAEAQILRNRIAPGAAIPPRGIVAGDRLRIEDNVVSGMLTDGIFCTDACTVTGNTTSNNGETGIQVALDAIVSANTSHGNNFDGIIVRGNTALLNGSYGLDLSVGTAYRENTIFAPTSSWGTVSGGTNVGANVCNGATTCP